MGAERDPHPPCCLWITPVDNFILKTGAVCTIGRKLNNRRTTTGQTTGATRDNRQTDKARRNCSPLDQEPLRS